MTTLVDSSLDNKSNNQLVLRNNSNQVSDDTTIKDLDDTSIKDSDDTSIEDSDEDFVVRGLSGFRNIGNTCYMNSTLQCLDAVTTFSSWLRSGMYKKRLCNNIIEDIGDKVRKEQNKDENEVVHVSKKDVQEQFDNSIVHQLSRLFEYKWKYNWKITPKTFKNLIGELNSEFAGYGLNDSQEVLSFILDRIHEETKTKVNVKFCDISDKLKEIIKFRKECSQKLADKSVPVENKKEISDQYNNFISQYPNEKTILNAYIYWKKYIVNSHSIITDLFTGLFYSRIECKECHQSSDSFEPFTNLSIETPDKEDISLQECLINFSKTENLDGDNQYNCSNCKKKVNATKTMYIWEPPEALIIHLKRFKNTYRYTMKTSSKVEFPIDELKLTNNLCPFHKKDSKYELCGITEHLGGSWNMGHYIAYCKNGINKLWYEFNDASVTHIPRKILEEEIVTKNAYVLFYSLKRD